MSMRPFQMQLHQLLKAVTNPPPPWDPRLAKEFADEAASADALLLGAIELDIRGFLWVAEVLYGSRGLARLAQDPDLASNARLAIQARRWRALRDAVRTQARRDVYAEIWGRRTRCLRHAPTVVAAYVGSYTGPTGSDEASANASTRAYLAELITTVISSRMHGAPQPPTWRTAFARVAEALRSAHLVVP